MASSFPPVNGTAYTTYVSLVSQADVNIFQTTVTLAAGDVTVSKDGGGAVNIAALPVEIAATGILAVDLTGTEMTADVVVVRFHDVAGAEWQDKLITLHTAAQTLDTAVSTDIPDNVWDEVLTSGTHDVGYSAGQRLRYMILTGNSARAGTANKIQLAATESATDYIYNENIISIVAGTGAGQTRLIAEYEGTDKWATVDKAWFTNPAAGSVYEILPFSSILVAQHGQATAGAASTITLSATASITDDIYIGSVIYISSGTGAGQVRLITDYDGTGLVATVTDAWTTQPDNTSVYKIIPVGRVIVGSMQADSITAASLATDASTEIWSSATRTLTSASTAPGTGLSANVWSVIRGDTLSRTFATIAADGTITKCQVTVKRAYNLADTAAVLAVDSVTGLIRLNGGVAGAFTGTFNITTGVLAIPAATMAELVPADYVYDVQVWRTAAVSTIEKGTFKVVDDSTRTITVAP